MTLKRLPSNYHNMHKRHIVVGDAMAVILALSSFYQVSHRWVPGEWNGADLLSRDRLLHQWRLPIVSGHVNATLNTDSANVGTRSQKQATQAGSPASSGARGSRNFLSLGQPSWDPGGNHHGNEGYSSRRAGVSRLGSYQPGEFEASLPHGCC